MDYPKAAAYIPRAIIKRKPFQENTGRPDGGYVFLHSMLMNTPSLPEEKARRDSILAALNEKFPQELTSYFTFRKAFEIHEKVREELAKNLGESGNILKSRFEDSKNQEYQAILANEDLLLELIKLDPVFFAALPVSRKTEALVARILKEAEKSSRYEVLFYEVMRSSFPNKEKMISSEISRNAAKFSVFYGYNKATCPTSMLSFPDKCAERLAKILFDLVEGAPETESTQLEEGTKHALREIVLNSEDFGTSQEVKDAYLVLLKQKAPVPPAQVQVSQEDTVGSGASMRPPTNGSSQIDASIPADQVPALVFLDEVFEKIEKAFAVFKKKENTQLNEYEDVKTWFSEVDKRYKTFAAAKTQASFQAFHAGLKIVQGQVTQTLGKHRGFGAYPLALRVLLGLCATILVIPAIVVAIKSSAGYTQTFFGRPETDSMKKFSALQKTMKEAENPPKDTGLAH